MKIKALCLAVLFFALPIEARPRPWYRDWRFWTVEAFHAATIAFDYRARSIISQRCPTCREMNSFLGPHPSNAALARWGTLEFGGYFAWNILSRPLENRIIRRDLGLHFIPSGIQSVEHLRGGISEEKLCSRAAWACRK